MKILEFMVFGLRNKAWKLVRKKEKGSLKNEEKELLGLPNLFSESCNGLLSCLMFYFAKTRTRKLSRPL